MQSFVETNEVTFSLRLLRASVLANLRATASSVSTKLRLMSSVLRPRECRKHTPNRRTDTLRERHGVIDSEFHAHCGYIYSFWLRQENDFAFERERPRSNNRRITNNIKLITLIKFEHE